MSYINKSIVMSMKCRFSQIYTVHMTISSKYNVGCCNIVFMIMLTCDAWIVTVVVC